MATNASKGKPERRKRAWMARPWPGRAKAAQAEKRNTKVCGFGERRMLAKSSAQGSNEAPPPPPRA